MNCSEYTIGIVRSLQVLRDNYNNKNEMNHTQISIFDYVFWVGKSCLRVSQLEIVFITESLSIFILLSITKIFSSFFVSPLINQS